MSRHSKVVVVPDACSLINLEKIRISHFNVLSFLRREMEILAHEVISNEVERNMEGPLKGEAKIWLKFLKGKVFKNRVLTDDQMVLSMFFTVPPQKYGCENAGERGNARLALEILLNRMAEMVVFVTDDQNAKNGFLYRMCKSFPSIILWSSVEVILFYGGILLKQKKVECKDVENALRDIRIHLHKGGTPGIIDQTKLHREALSRTAKIAQFWRT